ncbi:MAG: primosomal protein N', partial [Bacteroidota bacterium]
MSSNSVSPSLHITPATHTFVAVLLPLAIPKPYTYFVPEHFIQDVKFGLRVEVQFGKNKLYAGIIVNVFRSNHEISEQQVKPVLSILDDYSIITRQQWQLWQWLADYYCCTLGEVMNAALPANLKLSSETILILSPLFDKNMQGLHSKESIIVEALQHRTELSVKDIRDLLTQKTVHHIINKLLDKRIIYLKEDLKEKYKPKKIGCVRLQEPYGSESELLSNAFDLTSRSAKQTATLLAFVQLYKQQPFIRKQDLYNTTPQA